MTDMEVNLYIEEIAKLGSVMGLDTMRELLKRLGNPEKGFKTVHIAGTNGKGSKRSRSAEGPLRPRRIWEKNSKRSRSAEGPLRPRRLVKGSD